MNLNRIRKLISLFVTLLLAAACSAPPSGSTREPINTIEPNSTQPGVTEIATTQSVPTETPGAPETNLCGNSYYPVREGATWTYKSTGSPAGEFSFTDTITSVREDGFTLNSQFGGVSRTQEWSCAQEGLIALQVGGAPVVTLNAQGMQLELLVNNVSGVTFPKEITAGDHWQHNLGFEGQVGMAGQSGEAQGNAETRFTVISNENVTVPAGTFEALKIQVEPTLDMSVGFQGLSLPLTVGGTYTYWFVQNIGWVKASGTSNLAGQTLSETIELQSYNIP